MDKNNSKLSIVCFGEALWDFFQNEKQPGGAPMNVSYHLNKFKIPSLIVTKVGNDKLGVELTKQMIKMGLKVDYCQYDKIHPTGTVEAQMDSLCEVQYKIAENVAWDFIEWHLQLDRIVQCSSALIFGSLAMRNDVSYNTLRKLIYQSPYRVFDVNFRAPFINRNRILEVLNFTDLLKLNESELYKICDWIVLSEGKEEDRVNYIRQKFSINEVLITKGSLGATYYIDNKIYQYQAPVVKVSDTIGSGDAFLSGFLASKLKNKSDVQFQMNTAGALAAFVTSQRGACPSYSINDILINNQYFKQ